MVAGRRAAGAVLLTAFALGGCPLLSPIDEHVLGDAGPAPTPSADSGLDARSDALPENDAAAPIRRDILVRSGFAPVQARPSPDAGVRVKNPSLQIARRCDDAGANAGLCATGGFVP